MDRNFRLTTGFPSTGWRKKNACFSNNCNSNNGIVISKKNLLDGKNAMLNVPLLHGY
jgi:hypothetical protein